MGGKGLEADIGRKRSALEGRSIGDEGLQQLILQYDQSFFCFLFP